MKPDFEDGYLSTVEGAKFEQGYFATTGYCMWGADIDVQKGFGTF